MSLHFIRHFTPLAAVTAALVLQIGSAAAATPDDVQQQMRDVLAGKVTRPPAPSAASREQGGRPAADAQQLARLLLAGAGSHRASGNNRPGAARGHGDAQALAQQVLLGQRNAVAGS